MPHLQPNANRNPDPPALGTTSITTNARTTWEAVTNSVGPNTMPIIPLYPLKFRRLAVSETRPQAPISNGYYSGYRKIIYCSQRIQTCAVDTDRQFSIVMKAIYLLSIGLLVAPPANANPLLRLLFGAGTRSAVTGSAAATAARSSVANSAYQGALRGATQASRRTSALSGAGQLYNAVSSTNSSPGHYAPPQGWGGYQPTYHEHQPVQQAAPQMVQRHVYVGREYLGTCWDPYVGAWRHDYRDVYRIEWVPRY